jgi:hypothetical protein
MDVNPITCSIHGCQSLFIHIEKIKNFNHGHFFQLCFKSSILDEIQEGAFLVQHIIKGVAF